MVYRKFEALIPVFGIGSCLTVVVACANLAGAAETRVGTRSTDANFRIALVQPTPNVDIEHNLKRAEDYCRRASAEGADLILFPEMFSVGYQTSIDFENPEEVQAWKAKARREDGPFIDRLCRLAKELELAIAITYLEEREDELRNATTLIDRSGERLFTYAKVHTCRFFPMEGSLRPGDAFLVAELDTRAGPLKIGAMTCYDREFPESARILMLKGAELIVTPNACGLDHLRLKQFQIRAWENSVVTAMANYATGQGNGRSCVYGADGEELFLASGEEGLYFVDIDLNEQRRIRNKTFWGNAWRRTDLYDPLVTPDIDEPFKRTDAFGRPNSQSLGADQEK